MNPDITPPAIVNAAVARVLSESAAKTILLIGTASIAALDADPSLRIKHHDEPKDVGSLGGETFDVAIVAGVLSAVPHQTAIALLARLRDVLAHRVLIIDTTTPHNLGNRNDISYRAYGFRCLLTHQDAGQLWRVHEFSIDTYKTTPDWLNAKDWAHPQRFDKFRW